MCHRTSFICTNCATCEKGHTLVVSKDNTALGDCDRLHYDMHYEYAYELRGEEEKKEEDRNPLL